MLADPPSGLEAVGLHVAGGIDGPGDACRRNDGYEWLWSECSKDAGTKDGIGLPGTHSGASKLPPVTHDGMVWYQQGPHASAKIHGTISGADAGEVARLSTPGSTTAAPRAT